MDIRAETVYKVVFFLILVLLFKSMHLNSNDLIRLIIQGIEFIRVNLFTSLRYHSHV
jgi:hypothetical protein